MDIISKYKKAKKLKIIYIISSSFLLALSIQMTLLMTETWQMVKTSVLNSTNIWSQKQAQIYLEKLQNPHNTIVKLKTSNNIKDIKSFSFSMFYNPENIKIIDTFSQNNDIEIITISKDNWVLSLILNYNETKNINPNDEIINIVIEKKDNSKIEQLNILSTNFTDKNEAVYELTTSWIDI